MAFQKGFYGVSYAPEDTNSKQLVSALGSFNKSLQKYGEYVGVEQDKEVAALAERTARVDNFKSYQDGVDKGEIENTKSDFFIAHYDNIKGANAGSEYQIKKGIAYQEFWANQTNSDQDDTDGSGYLAWSQQYDQENLDQYKTTSTFFQKSLDKSIAAVNQQLGSRYAADNSKRIKEKYSLEFITRNEDLIRNTPPTELFKTLTTLDQTSDQFRALSKQERKALVLQSFKNVIAEKARLGEIESDYFSAIELAEELRDYKGANGFTYLDGKNPEEWDKYIQTLRSEQVKHDENIIRMEFGKQIDAIVEGQAKQLWGDMTSTFNNVGGEGADKATIAYEEYNKRAKELLVKNQGTNEFSPQELQTELLQMRRQVVEKYNNIVDITKELVPFNLNMENRFNIRKDKKELNAMILEMGKMTNKKTSSRGTETTEKVFTFQEAIVELNDSDEYGSMMRFALASAKVNGYTNKNGKVTAESLGRWYTDYNKFVGKQLDPGYELVPREDD